MLVAVTYLQQNSPDELRPPKSNGAGSRLVKQIRPAPTLAQFLYRRIGSPYGWSSRLAWTDSDWERWLERRETEFWISWHYGQLTGFAELHLGQSADQATTCIKYLGLLPEVCGLGLGSHLVAQANQRAWTAHRRESFIPPVRRVVLETSSLDSPRALQNYLARGFRIVGKRGVERAVSGEP